MRLTGLCFAFLLSLTTARADVISDPFNVANCTSAQGPSFTTCDTIGDKGTFDIQSATVTRTGNQLSTQLAFNTNSVTMAPFVFAGLNLNVGDLLFYNPGSGLFLYGAPVYTHGSFLAGNLYKIGGGITAINAQTALSNQNPGVDLTPYSFRRTDIVWLGGSGSAIAGAPVTVTKTTQMCGATPCNGSNGAEFLATLTFDMPASFLSDLTFDDRIGIAFASATCGNDILRGTAAVPEPTSFAVIGLAALGLVISSYRRFHQSRS